MKFSPMQPPRRFQVGLGTKIEMADCGRVALEPDEQLTFVTESGAEYDVARKSWGFYATPSMNARLKRFGLRAAFVRSKDDKYYVFLVEKGRESAFDEYLRVEGHRVAGWLDEDAALARMAAALEGGAGAACLCGGTRFEAAFHYDSPPSMEVRFAFAEGQRYSRDLLRCAACGHFLSIHDMDMSALYSGDYVSANYKDAAGLKATFDKINALPPERSDNAGRVQRVGRFADGYFPGGRRGRSVLDVGSGLCVFLNRMKADGWSCTAVDPDERSARHARETVGVAALVGDFMGIAPPGAFDAVTFNKVLEHVKDPVAMLARASAFVKSGGFVYVELPDGEAAAEAGFDREEFTIDHHHVFSAASFSVLIERAGFRLLELERLVEPSGKYTLRGFTVPRGPRGRS